uniref:Uncharacterized protein n=1 Tax=Romanomermis culicivorax TaxID=13658 RepID=A0A915IV91_ROMCU
MLNCNILSTNFGIHRPNPAEATLDQTPVGFDDHNHDDRVAGAVDDEATEPKSHNFAGNRRKIAIDENQDKNRRFHTNG